MVDVTGGFALAHPCDACHRHRHGQCFLLADLRIGAGVNRWCGCKECRPLAIEVSQERMIQAVLAERKCEVMDGAVTLGIKEGEKTVVKAEWERATRQRRIEVDVYVRLGKR